VVEPEHAFWDTHDASDGTPVAEDFVYSSDRNTRWLDLAELRELLATVPHTTTAVPAPVG
jgi:hypothetical protein